MDTKSLLDIATLIGIVIFGVFAVIGWFDKAKRATEKEADQTEEKVIQLLKEQVAALETKVNLQAQLLDETTRKLDQLVTENRTLKDVLQGRDKTAMEYQTAGREAMKKGEEILTLVQNIKLTVDRLSVGQTNVTVQK
jgi:hypothetical protein